MIFGEGPIIKNIAGDLNKLFLQGTRAAQPIINVEGDAAADQATVQLMADRDPVIRDISTGLGWAGREVTVSGTGALQLVNSLGRPLKSWSVELAPYQEGSGDPSPENVRPIHGTNKLTITTAGRNLFGGEAFADAIAAKVASAVKNTANKTITYSAQAIDNVIIAEGIFKPNTRYTVIVNGSNASQLQAPNLKLTYTDGTTLTVGQFVDGVIAVTSEAGKTVRSLDGVWSTGTTTLNYELCGIFEGVLTADQFEPYQGKSVEINLPQTVYTGTVGSDGGVNTQYKLILDGSEIWTLSAQVGRFFYTYTDTMKKWTSYVSNRIMCDKLLPCTNQNSDEYLQTVDAVTGYADFNNAYPNQNWIYAKADSRATAAEFKTWLTENPVTVVYDLATPSQFALTNPIIPTIEGDGFIWVTAENGIITSFSATYLQSE